MTSEIPTYEHVAKLFLESEFQRKLNKRKMQILSKILRFSRQPQIQ